MKMSEYLRVSRKRRKAVTLKEKKKEKRNGLRCCFFLITVSDVTETVTGNVKLRFFLHSGKYFYLLSCENRMKFQVIFKYKYR